MLLPDGADRYAMRERQSFLMPLPLRNALPEFAASLSVREMAPTTVCAEITISAAGRVDRIVALTGVDACTAAAGEVVTSLRQEVDATLRRWRFEPAAICTYPDAQTMDRAHGECPETAAGRVAIPVKLAYAFTFEAHDGRRRVGANRVEGR